MKMTNTPKSTRGLIAVAGVTFLACHSSSAQNLFTNGALEGTPTASDSVVAPNWQAVSYIQDRPFVIASPGPSSNVNNYTTPDLTSSIGPSMPGWPWNYRFSGNPHGGSTFMSGLYGGDPTIDEFGGPYIFDEGIRQSVSLIGGQAYSISLYQAVMVQVHTNGSGAPSGYAPANVGLTGGWRIYLGDTLLGTTAFSTKSTPSSDTTLVWDARTVNFTAATTGAQYISFMPAGNNPMGTMTRMALDSLSLTAIPEPGSTMLLGLGGMFAFMRRRRLA